MKFAVATILALPFASAFMQTASRSSHGTRLQMAVVTGAGGKAATSSEEDLALTLKIIMDHADRSATVSKEQFISQVSEAQNVEAEEFDISIPYDAAAKNAYEASDKSMAYASFKTKFEADAVAAVIAKQPVDVSIPYDAAAKNAYEASDKSMAYASFKTKFEADAVAAVIAKKQ